MINEDDLISKESREAFYRLTAKAVQAGKPLEEYLQAYPLSNDEKEAIIEYQKKLDHLAVNVLLGIDHFLLNQNIVESILETYKKSCHSLKISEKPITDEMRLRLRFECLCFSTFYASLQSSKYLTEKKSFIKPPNWGLNQLFHGALGASLIKLCNNTGMSGLHEITWFAIDPASKFDQQFGDHLDPLNRLEEYRSASVKEQGSELKRFGKLIGFALDAPHYPFFEVIGSAYGLELIKSNMITKIFDDLRSSQKIEKSNSDINNTGTGNTGIIKCNNCYQKIRAPLGKRLRVTCPNCNNKFEVST